MEIRYVTSLLSHLRLKECHLFIMKLSVLVTQELLRNGTWTKRLRKKDSLHEEEIISDLISSLFAFLNIICSWRELIQPINTDILFPSEENCKVDKVALWLINCALFYLFLVYKNLDLGSELKYKELWCKWQKPGLQMRSRPHKRNQTRTQCDLDHQPLST
jgi:hypothetical protein